MKDIYADSFERYARDVDFKMLVDFIFTSALSHGFTPGEVKQAAFLASLKAEQHSTKLTETSWQTKSR